MVQDGAQPTDIIHLYLECDGMDHTFVHNPAGPFAIRLQELLNPNGLHTILERFALMIQSGRNVSLDNHTRLTICAYSPIQGGAKLCGIHNTKDSFVRSSTSIIRIANDGDEMCFAYAFALALAKQQRDKDPGTSTHYMNWISSRYKTNYGPWKQIATSLHTSVGLHYTQSATYKEIAELADMYFVQIHIFDLNGIEPDFCYHSPKRGHADHLFFLQDH